MRPGSWEEVRVRVLDLSGRGQPPVVDIETGAAYEFLVSLVALSAPEPCPTFDIGEEWYRASRATLSADLAATLARFAARDGASPLWGKLVGLASTAPEPRDVSAFLAALEATEPLELRLHLVGYYARHAGERDAAIAAVTEGGAALEPLLEHLYPDDPAPRQALHELFSREPGETKRFMLEALARWYDEVFRAREAALLPVLARDAEAKRALARSLPAERLIELATNGIEYAAEPGIRRVALIPSVILRPWNLMTAQADTRLICYPVADESLVANPDAPPARLVKLYRALGDERRLRVLKRLSGGSGTLQELADAVGVQKSTMHHHMAILRAAGLVRVRSGEEMRYTLRRDLLPDVAEQLKAYLGVGDQA